MVKGEEFTRVLKEEIAANPGIEGPNYKKVRTNVSRRLKISKKKFDEILGYMIVTGHIKNVWLFPSLSAVRPYHKNMGIASEMIGIPGFDTIESQGEGIHYNFNKISGYKFRMKKTR